MCEWVTTTVAYLESSPARWRRPFLKWMDGIEAGWGIPLLLVGFVAVWMIYFSIAYYDGDLHPDVLETWTYGRSIEWGYTKHPPLMGWVARAWTSVFPLANWSFELLALTNAAVALWVVDLIARRFMRGDKRMVVLLLLMLMPTYQFHAQRFNANTVLLAAWPIATYCFLRSFQERHVGWAIAAGATAALAMLGKYYSAFLIASFLLAAICHPQRRAYFSSLAPWISAVTGLAALGPHLYWLATTGAKPINYALVTHAGKTLVPSLDAAILFLLGVSLVLALPAATWALMVNDRMRKFAEEFRTMDPGLLLLFLIGAGTIAFPVIAAVGLGTDMPPIWALQGLFVYAIRVVGSTSFRIERFYTVNLAVFVIAVSVGCALVVAPVHAVYRNDHPLHEGRNFYRQAALELTQHWHRLSNTELPTVGGDDVLAFAAAFYSPDHPLYEERLALVKHEGPPPPQLFERGWAALCFATDASCISAIEGIAAPASYFVKFEFQLQSTLLGQPGATERFTALMVPPSIEAEPPQAKATAEE